VEGPKEEVQVRVAIDRQDYRPGEAVLVAVEIANLTDREMTVRALNFDSAKFYFAATDKDLSFRRDPVYSKNEIPQRFATISLAAKGTERRDFVLTRLTERQGEYVLTVGYSLSAVVLPGMEPPEDQGQRKKALQSKAMNWSNPAVYRVAGDPACHRDSKGVLLKDDAVDLCLKRFGRSASTVETELIWNEGGFLDWWVCLTVAPETLGSGEPAKHAWFVNPYLARIRKEAPVRLTYLRPKAKDATKVTRRVGAAAGPAGQAEVAAPAPASGPTQGGPGGETLVLQPGGRQGQSQQTPTGQ